MKKSGLVLFSMAVALSSAASDMYGNSLAAEDTHPETFLQVSLATPVQLPQPNWSIYGLRLDLIYGESYDVAGLDLGLVGYNRNRMSGLQANLLSGWVDGDMKGVQFSFLSNVVGGNATGVQFSFVVNYTRGEFTGAKAAPINYDGTFYGLQFGGFNYAKGVSWGLQFGLANASVNEFHGWAVSAINYAHRMNGLQLGLVNIATETARGVQIGVFNAAETYNGLQIGLLNIISNGELPIMPFINGNF